VKDVVLEAEGIDTFYGRSQILFGMSLRVCAGEVVTLMGRNGMGKTTTVRSLMGLTRASRGSIRVEGRELRGSPAFKVARHGLAVVPEGRQVFPNLTVSEHLKVAQANRSANRGEWTLARAFALFPGLADRRSAFGNQLSGGEQQMLAIARALVTNPRILILDEATEGLAPLMRDEIWRCLDTLKKSGLSLLLIDKDLEALTRLADQHTIIEKGRVAWSGTSDDLRMNGEIQRRYLGI